MIPTSDLANVIDIDFLNPGFYDAEFVRTSTRHVFNLDLLDSGIYDAKLGHISSAWESDGVDPYENVAKVIRPNSGMDMNLLDPGFYNAKLVNSFRSILGSRKTTSSKSKIICGGYCLDPPPFRTERTGLASTPLASAPPFLLRKDGAFFG